MGSGTTCSHVEKTVHTRTPLSELQTSILGPLYSILATVKQDSSLPRLRKDVSHRETSLHLNGFFLKSGVRGMLNLKHNYAVDMVFSFVSGLIDELTGYTLPAMIAVVHAM